MPSFLTLEPQDEYSWATFPAGAQPLVRTATRTWCAMGNVPQGSLVSAPPGTPMGEALTADLIGPIQAVCAAGPGNGSQRPLVVMDVWLLTPADSATTEQAPPQPQQ